MENALLKVPCPKNESVKDYRPGSPERQSILNELNHLSGERIEIPLLIGGKEVRTGNIGQCVCPHRHHHILATYHKAGKNEVQQAINSAMNAWKEWSEMPWAARAAVFLKAGELLAGKYRYIANAATMLNQSKNVYQAEIDAACELIDFWRFNVFYMSEIYRIQPYSSSVTWNLCDYRALEGFVFAITPFNFTSIAGNLPTCPAIMGNVAIWKPASSSVYSGYFIMKVLMEAGLPPGVVNFVPGSGGEVGFPVMSHPKLSGIHFTGSTKTFQELWKFIGNNIHLYQNYPRIVGETGGKDFVFCHRSAEPLAVATALVRGAFEYQGQKCSAASRVYVPDNLWPQVKTALLDQMKSIKMGPVEDFSNFINAVIDAKAFKSITNYIEFARKSTDAEIIAGDHYDDSEGYFIQPTVILTTDPKFKTMQEEIFGPVLTIFVYPAAQYEETLELCNETSPYGLTGSIFAQERSAIITAYQRLRYAAGNFYINDKPTAAVVGQQPFGGARSSGTNDKAGSKVNLIRWVNIRTVKETFVPPSDYRYPFMEPDDQN